MVQGPSFGLGAMVTGGVLERHPTLRVGAIEYAAHWIGPMASNLDLWHDNGQVKDPAMLDKMKAGDKIRFKPEKVGGNYTVTEYQPAE